MRFIHFIHVDQESRESTEDRLIIIHPFRACRFNPAVVGDASLCCSPPYDQYTPEMIDHLESQSPFNVSRIVKAGDEGREHVDSTGERYRGAAALFAKWREQQVVVSDPRPGIYPYSQTYKASGVKRTRYGFIALADLSETNRDQIFGHEKTIPPIREDRARLRLATAADFGLVFLLYSDPSRSLDRLLETTAQKRPILEAHSSFDGSLHRVWYEDSPGQVDAYTNHMLHLKTVIADGHHRFAAAQQSFETSKNPGSGRVMAGFFNTQSEGMAIFPIHRLVVKKDVDPIGTFLDACRPCCEIAAFERNERDVQQIADHLDELIAARHAVGEIAFGVVAKDVGEYYLLSIEKPLGEDLPWPPDRDKNWRTLETAVFETVIMKAALGYTAEQIDRKEGLDFRKETLEAVNAVYDGQASLGFILPPTDLDAILQTALAGQMLPQKSTFFFPKLLTGLTIHCFGG